MKNFVKRLLQGLLGWENYLFLFARYIIATLKCNRKEGDFLHFAGMLKDGDTVLDIGANIGAMSVHLARKLPHSRIWAFEPIPVNVKTFKRVIRHFALNNVTLVEQALGDHTGEVEMVLPVQHKAKLHGLSHVVHESISDFNSGQHFKVKMARLDDYPGLRDAPSISGIKLDVENFEYFVLKGAIELLKRHKPIIYAELWDNQNRQNCFALMKSIGYSIKVLNREGLTHFDPEKHSNQNFFFTPESQ